jgi:tetratricopeptide (TPR) repeat protein
MRLFGPRRPRSFDELPSRFLQLSGPRVEPGPAPAAPGRWSTTLLIGLAGVLIVALALVWRGGGPQGANGHQARPPSPEAVAAAIEASRVYMLRSQPTKGEIVLRGAIAQYPDEADLRVALAELLVFAGRLEDAYGEYVRALAIGPRTPLLEFAAGTLASRLARHDRALEHFSMARAQAPGNATYALYLGQVQRRVGDLPSAKVSLLAAAQIDPENAAAWGSLADIALQENNVHLALQHVGRARELQPRGAAWRIIEARALNRMGNPEAALLRLRDLEPPERFDPAVLELTGQCFGLLGRPRDAANLYVQAIAQRPDDPVLAFNAALWFERAGERGRAAEYATQALRQGHPEAQRVLDRLKG